jgi:hypothetical protein
MSDIFGVGSAVSGIAGAASSIYGANLAASTAREAANQVQKRYETTRGDLSPFFTTGQSVLPDLTKVAQSGPTGGGPDFNALAYANLPGTMTQAQLEATPGYQFTRDQGLASVRARNASRGLGMSSAALKGAAEYATGLADKTYLDQFNVQQQRFTDYLNLNTGQQSNLTGQFNRLKDVATLGENAAAQTGTIGQSAANTAAGYLNAAGLNQAAGFQNATNALTNAGNNYAAYNAFTQRTAGLTGYTAGGGGASGQNYGPAEANNS